MMSENYFGNIMMSQVKTNAELFFLVEKVNFISIEVDFIRFVYNVHHDDE